jgi:hypothetical protein
MSLLWRSQRDTLWTVPLSGLGDSPRVALAAQAGEGPQFPRPPADGGRQTDGWLVRHCLLYPIDVFSSIITNRRVMRNR